MKSVSIIIISLLALVGCATTGMPASDGRPASAKEISKHTEARPTIIIAHGCDGVSQPYRDWARELHSWGYNTVLADSFQFRGYGILCDGANNHKVMPIERKNDLVEIAKFVKQQPWHKGKIGAIGFSHGGSTMLAVAASNQTDIDAVVAYYPSCHRWFVFSNLTQHLFEPSIAVQVHLAEKDDWTPIVDCNYLTGAEEYIYKGATHAFDMDYPARTYLGHFLKYDRQADLLSRKRTKEFFEVKLISK
jgi:dienelactone hydrolase